MDVGEQRCGNDRWAAKLRRFPGDPALQATADPYTALQPLGPPGGVAEWSKAAVLKTAERKLRGFESLLLRWLDNRIVSRKWSGLDARRCFSAAPQPVFGRPASGEMAEWLKAPVC